MAIELNNRTKILAGVVALAAVGAGAWFFFLDDFLNAPPPKPAAKASVTASAAKPAAGQPAAEAPKQAAAAPKPGAKPIPTDPDKLIAEVIETSGVKVYLESLGRQAALSSGTAGQAQKAGASAPEARELIDLAGRVFERGKLSA